MTRISLDDGDFKTLVNGGVVKQDGAEIILKDIGFMAMENHITDAVHNTGN
jgi:hypothetical protein